jgi:hypothetical protein
MGSIGKPENCGLLGNYTASGGGRGVWGGGC